MRINLMTLASVLFGNTITLKNTMVAMGKEKVR